MAVVKSADKDVTTLIVDVGWGLIPVYVEKPIAEVHTRLQQSGWIAGDSEIGEIEVPVGSVKYSQTGRRELNRTADNRPSNLPL